MHEVELPSAEDDRGSRNQVDIEIDSVCGAFDEVQRRVRDPELDVCYVAAGYSDLLAQLSLSHVESVSTGSAQTGECVA
jgi:hypothetical protein